MTSHYESLGILTIPQIIALENAKFGFKYTHAELPVRIKELIGCDQHNQSLKKIVPTKPGTKSYQINQRVLTVNIVKVFYAHGQTTTPPF